MKAPMSSIGWKRGWRKMRLERLPRLRLRRGSMPCGGIKVSMVLNSKNIPLNLYLEYQSGRLRKNVLYKDRSGSRETRKEPVFIQM